MRKSTRLLILQLAICSLQFAFCPAAALVAVAISAQAARAQWPWSGLLSEPAPVGTPTWWKQIKKSAVFEVGKGWAVPGVEGYFDDDGRPINGPVAAERVARAAAPASEEGLMPALDPQVQLERVKEAVGLGPNEQLAREAYARGTELFQAGNYGAAADAYAEAASRGVHLPLEQDAMFMLAESYYFNDRYIKARDAYDALVHKHANTRYLDRLIERQWSIGQYWEKYEDYSPDWSLTPNAIDRTRPWLDTIGHAIKTYDSIRLNDPTGPRADDAIMATANIYFRRGRFDDADHHYSLLRREYPRSELQFEAHLLGLQSKLRKYQGPDYDAAPLEEAKDLVVQIRRQFTGRLSPDERERLRTVEAQLRRELAMQDFTMAEYYDGTRHYRSARMYYDRVARQFPDTDLAAKARDRVAQIANEPDEPPKFLAGFIDLFPQSSDKSRLARVPEIRDGKTRIAEAPENVPGGVQQAGAQQPGASGPR
jgi:outer membrane protein assembly factor BamD (BamD/ComL family)